MKVLVAGPVLGVGGLLDFTSSEIELEDKLPTIQPDNFNGSAGMAGINLTFVVGGGITTVELGGDGFSHPGDPLRGARGTARGVTVGYGGSISALQGTSTLIDTHYESCICDSP